MMLAEVHAPALERPYSPAIAEMTVALTRATSPQRARLMLRVVDLYIATMDDLNDDAIAVFDELMVRQLGITDHATLVTLSRILAPLAKPPPQLIHTLADDADIAIAGPVLSRSPFLTPHDLVRIAMIHGQDHLHAICSRAEIPEVVTSTLIARGGPSLRDRLLMMPGARYRAADFLDLVSRATTDERGRVRVHQRATLATTAGEPIIDCDILNISQNGAGVVPDRQASVPDELVLIMHAVRRRRVPCRLVWKTTSGLGVVFVG